MHEQQDLFVGPFRLDLHDARLWRGPEALPLSPKTFAVLSCLVTRAGELGTKDAELAATEANWIGYGQCVDHYGVGEPYLPVLEALGRLCRAPEGASLVALLRQYAPSWLVQMPALLPPADREALQLTTHGATNRA